MSLIVLPRKVGKGLVVLSPTLRDLQPCLWNVVDTPPTFLVMTGPMFVPSLATVASCIGS